MGKDGSGRRAEIGAGLSQADAPRRLIYGRRLGRPLTARARDALDHVLPQRAAPLGQLADLPALFPGCSDFAFEVGFGGGEHLIAQAALHPQTGFIGAESFLNGVAKLTDAARQYSNIRIHHGDARDVLDHLPDGSLAALFVLFPDPWPKARHAKRRFIGMANLAPIARVLKPDGVLRIASDIPAYIEWSLCEIAHFNRVQGRAFALMAGRADDWRVRPADWPATRYEAKALAAGRMPAYLGFAKTP